MTPKTAGVHKYDGNKIIDKVYALTDLLNEIKRDLGDVGDAKAVFDAAKAAVLKLEAPVKKLEAAKGKKASTEDASLRTDLLRLAHEVPELRAHLLPILKQAGVMAATGEQYVKAMVAWKKSAAALLKMFRANPLAAPDRGQRTAAVQQATRVLAFIKDVENDALLMGVYTHYQDNP